MTEIDAHSELTLKRLMVLEEQVIVRRDCAQFRIAFADTSKRAMHIRDGDRDYLLNECSAQFAICDGEEYARAIATGHNEVRFGIADTHAIIDVLWPCIDQSASIKYPDTTPSLSLSPLSLLSFAQGFNLAPVHAF